MQNIISIIFISLAFLTSCYFIYFIIKNRTLLKTESEAYLNQKAQSFKKNIPEDLGNDAPQKEDKLITNTLDKPKDILKSIYTPEIDFKSFDSVIPNSDYILISKATKDIANTIWYEIKTVKRTEDTPPITFTFDKEKFHPLFNSVIATTAVTQSVNVIIDTTPPKFKPLYKERLKSFVKYIEENSEPSLKPDFDLVLKQI